LVGAAGADGVSQEQLPGAPGVVSALPGGTVTFAFTDIEGSTLVLQLLGEDRYADSLARHRQIVRGAFYAADGIEIDRQGDALFFALPRAQEAVGAAVEIQRTHACTAWPDGVRVRVRIGLHTGEPSIGAEGYLGVDVVKGARICSVARGGQVLLSAATHALTASKLPAGVTIVPVGERKLKGIDRAEALYSLVINDPTAATEDGRASRPVIPAAWERQIEERFGTVGAKVARGIGGRIADSLEGTNVPRAVPPAWEAVRDESLEHLAARAVSSLDAKIRAGARVARTKRRPGREQTRD
jgi:class 3 adenylate cyclase